MFNRFVQLITLIKDLIDLHEKGYLLNFCEWIFKLLNTKLGKFLMTSLLISFVCLMAVKGTVMGEIYLLKKGSVLISLIPPFILTLSAIPFSFFTYQLLYKKARLN